MIVELVSPGFKHVVYIPAQEGPVSQSANVQRAHVQMQPQEFDQ